MPTGFEQHYFYDVRTAVEGIYTPRRGLVLAAVVIACFLFLINSSWQATPDSALYLELGESLAAGKGYVFNSEPHTYVPPGYPALVAFAARLNGGFLGYRILMALLGLGAAASAYFLMVRLFDRHTALVIGGLFAINHVLVSQSTMTSSDVPFALSVLVSLHVLVWTSERRSGPARACVAGIATGLPALIRVNGWGLPPVGAVLLHQAWKDRGQAERWILVATFLVAAVIPGALWELHKASVPPSFSEGTYLNAVMGRNLGTQLAIVLSSAWGYISETNFAITGLSIKTGILEAIVPALAAVGAVTTFMRGERLFVLLTAVQFCGLALSPAGSRYLLPLLPGLYLFLAVGVLRLCQWTRMRTDKHPGLSLNPRITLLSVFAVLAIINLGHDAATILRARTALERNGPETSRDLPFFTAARWLDTHAPEAVVLTMYPRVLHYLSGVRTVELVRSGVPEHEVWVNRRQEIERLIVRTKPSFLFSDARNKAMLREVRAAVTSLGLHLEEVSDARAGSRFQLWRIAPATPENKRPRPHRAPRKKG
jgi:hypothetical protein